MYTCGVCRDVFGGLGPADMLGDGFHHQAVPLGCDDTFADLVPCTLLYSHTPCTQMAHVIPYCNYGRTTMPTLRCT